MYLRLENAYMKSIPDFRSSVEATKWFERYGSVIQTHLIRTSTEDLLYFDFYPDCINDPPVTLCISESGRVQILRLN